MSENLTSSPLHVENNSDPELLIPGKTYGEKYRISKLVSDSGAFGKVYQAYDTSLNINVAVKSIRNLDWIEEVGDYGSRLSAKIEKEMLGLADGNCDTIVKLIGEFESNELENTGLFFFSNFFLPLFWFIS